jgi:diacylglycerol O-acyltransferase / wax synthase
MKAIAPADSMFTNKAESLDFGLVGCRRSIPHLHRMLGHLETSLKELEAAVGL